jgi:hypothetical protein
VVAGAQQPDRAPLGQGGQGVHGLLLGRGPVVDVGVVEVEALDTELAQAGLGVLLDRLGPQALPVLGAGVAGLVQLDGAVDGAAVVARAAAAGVRVANLDTYRVGDTAVGPGLVLGYGNLADGQVEEAVALLATAVTEAKGAVTSSGPDRR